MADVSKSPYRVIDLPRTSLISPKTIGWPLSRLGRSKRYLVTDTQTGVSGLSVFDREAPRGRGRMCAFLPRNATGGRVTGALFTEATVLRTWQYNVGRQGRQHYIIITVAAFHKDLSSCSTFLGLNQAPGFGSSKTRSSSTPASEHPLSCLLDWPGSRSTLPVKRHAAAVRRAGQVLSTARDLESE